MKKAWRSSETFKHGSFGFARKQAGLSESDLAAAIGCRSEDIRDIESGRKYRPRLIANAAAHLGVPVEQFYWTQSGFYTFRYWSAVVEMSARYNCDRTTARRKVAYAKRRYRSDKARVAFVEKHFPHFTKKG